MRHFSVLQLSVSASSRYRGDRKVTSPKSFSPKSFLKLFGQNPDFWAPRSFFIFFGRKAFFQKIHPVKISTRSQFLPVEFFTRSEFPSSRNFYPVEISTPLKFLPSRNFSTVEISTPSKFLHRPNFYPVEFFTRSKFPRDRNFHPPLLCLEPFSKILYLEVFSKI